MYVCSSLKTCYFSLLISTSTVHFISFKNILYVTHSNRDNINGSWIMVVAVCCVHCDKDEQVSRESTFLNFVTIFARHSELND